MKRTTSAAILIITYMTFIAIVFGMALFASNALEDKTILIQLDNQKVYTNQAETTSESTQDICPQLIDGGGSRAMYYDGSYLHQRDGN